MRGSGSASTVEDQNIAIVEITDADYAGDTFHRRLPAAPVAGVSRLIRAVALSSPKVIVVDLDSGHWTSEQRAQLRSDIEQARNKAGLKGIVEIAWAIGGSQGAGGRDSDTGSLTIEPIDDPASCFGVPAATPDTYGVVRGYLPYVPQNHVPIPSLAIVAGHLAKGQGCTGNAHAPVNDELPEADLINYSGGGCALSASHRRHLTRHRGHLGLAEYESPAIEDSRRRRLVPEGRHRYVTPDGYLNGLDTSSLPQLSPRRRGRSRNRREAGSLLWMCWWVCCS